MNAPATVRSRSATARPQPVRVPALRHGAAPLDPVRQRVAVEDRDALVGVRDRTRREQAGDAAADHHRVLAEHHTRSSGLRFHAPTSSGHSTAWSPWSRMSAPNSPSQRSPSSCVVSPNATAAGSRLR
jgi:hypothetical protein